MSEAGPAGVGGFLMVGLAVFMVDPTAGFRTLLLPLGVVGATAPLVHLVASWRAGREESPENTAWRTVAERSGRVMTASSQRTSSALMAHSSRMPRPISSR